MTTLGHSYINPNQILQPNIAGGANPSNSHFTDPGPQFSSIVGGVSGCGGAGGSAAALYANPGYNIAVKQYGGKNGAQRRGGNKRSGKSGGNKRSGKSGHNKRHSNKRSAKRSNKRHSTKRGMRGGYHQFTGNQPLSFNYGLGVNAPIPPSDSWMANPAPMNNIHNNCGPNYGLVNSKLLN